MATVSAAPPVGDKSSARRDELAAAALRTLATRGYANTSLREIAQNSDYSHGVLHYYFADKTELIIHCVRLYKGRCVRRYADVTAARTPAAVLARFVRALATSLAEDSDEQRLWYDMRAQSLYEPAFRADVAAIDAELCAMVWRILSRYAELGAGALRVDAGTAYALFDGIFSHAVHAHLAGEVNAGAALEARVRDLVGGLVADPGAARSPRRVLAG